MTDHRVRCDACGKPALPVHYDYVRDQNDGTGRTEWSSKEIDLCHEHTIEWLNYLLLAKVAPSCFTGSQEKFTAWAKAQKWEPKI